MIIHNRLFAKANTTFALVNFFNTKLLKMSLFKLLYPCLLMVCMFVYTPMSYAQPSNDDPCNAINLGVLTSCSSANFTTNLATPTTGPAAPGCGDYVGGDVWFQVTMPNNGYHVILEMTAGTMVDGAMAVYSGSDCSNLSLVSCDDNSGTGSMPTLTIDDGCNFSEAFATFWVRVWEEGNDAPGNFDICAYAVTPAVPSAVTGCGSNPITGNTCCDALLLTDELDGYCGNTDGYTDDPDEIAGFCAFIENNSWIAFIANDTEIEIELTSFNCVSSMGVQAQILETTDCTNFSLISNCWNPGSESTGTLSASSLTPGETYYLMIDGWNGDVCDYTISVINGIETTSVTASDEVICNGENTQLFANVYGVGPYTYSWSPSATLSDPTIWNPVATPTVDTEYEVTVTWPTGSFIDTVLITVFTSPPGSSTINGLTTICENTAGNTYTCVNANAASYIWTVTGGATIDGANDQSSLIVDWGTSGGTVCVTPSNECAAGAETCVTVNVSAQPNISANNPPVACGSMNLTTIPISNSAGGIGTISYHNDASSANAGSPTIPSPIVNTSGTYWIRYQTTTDCYDITSVTVTVENPELVIVDPQSKCSPNTIDLDLDVWKNEVNGFPGGTYTYYADTLDAVNETGALASNLVTTTNIYWVRYETPSGCFDVAPIDVTIDVAPDVSANEELFICNGGSVDISTISITDANGATITDTYYFTSESFAVQGFTALAMSNTTVSTATTYYARYETAANCWDTAHIIVNTAVTPDAIISGGGALCAGTNGELTFTLTGTGPFDITYTDGPNSFVANGVTSPHTESVVVNINTTFTITNITDQTACPGTSSGSATFTVNSAPDLVMTGGTNLCSGVSGDLNFNLTGTGPFDVVYTDGTNNFTLDDITTGHMESVSPTSTTTYSPVSVTDANACTGAIFGGATMTVSPAIQISNITETCDGSNFNYTVSFQITGGDPATYDVVGAGTLDPGTNIFTSSILASGASYSFDVSDANCGPYNVNGAFACNCISDAGTMGNGSGAKHVCESANVSMNFNNDATLDGDDVLGFVLHEGSGTAIVNPHMYSSTIQPSFNYSPILTFGQTYYVSSVVGNDDGTGFPVLNSSLDPCLSISPGQELIFYQETEISLSAPAYVCSGESADITFNFTAPGTYNVEYTIDGTTANLSGISDGHIITVNPSVATTYSLVQVNNTGLPFCTGFIDPATATVTIDIASPPTVTTETFACNQQNTTYTVTFDINGGNASGYAVTGISGTITGNTFVSDPIPSGNTYSFEVTDNTCEPNVIVTGDYTCSCVTTVGTMESSTSYICESASVTGNYDNTLEVQEADDALGYVLHTNSGNTLGSVVMSNATPNFSFGPPLQYEVTYYLSAVVGNDDGTGFPVLDPALDVCLKVAPGQPVIFYQETEASLSAPLYACEGETVDIVFNFTAPGTYNAEYTIDGNTFNLSAISDGHILTISPTAQVTYSLVQVSNTGLPFCTGFVDPATATVTIDIATPPGVENEATDCDDQNAFYTVSFDIIGGNASAGYTVTGDPGTLTGNTFVSTPIPAGNAYSFEVSDNTCGPNVMVTGIQACDCAASVGLMETVTSQVCESASVTGVYDNTFEVMEADDAFGYVLHTNSGTTLGTVMMTSTTPTFSFGPPLVFGETYYISAVVGNDDGTGFPVLAQSLDACLQVAAGQPVIFYQETEVSISAPTTICSGEEADIVFSFTGDELYTVEYTDGTNSYTLTGIGDGYVLNLAPTANTTYSLIQVSNTGSPFCVGTIDPFGGSVSVDVFETPVISNFLFECDELSVNYVITFEITGGNASNYSVTGGLGDLLGNVFTSAPIPGGTSYAFEVNDGGACPVTVSGTQLCNCSPDMQPLLSIEDQVSCNGLSDAVLAVEGFSGEPPYSFEWSTGIVSTSLSDVGTGWYYVTMTDANSCAVRDSIFVGEPDPITAEFTTTSPLCYGENDGTITLTNLSGGSGNYSFEMNALATLQNYTFSRLEGGTYEVTVYDDEGCSFTQEVTVDQPEEFMVSITTDQTEIQLGDSIDLRLVTNMDLDTFYWSPKEVVPCVDCETQVIYPFETVNLLVTATNEDGCVDTDRVTITVKKDRPIYIPNAFSPNGDGINDYLNVYPGIGITQIKTFKIFTRWGALVYSNDNFMPEYEDEGWDGYFKGRIMNQGVYIYYLEIELIDGSSETIKGDVTIVK